MVDITDMDHWPEWAWEDNKHDTGGASGQNMHCFMKYLFAYSKHSILLGVLLAFAPGKKKIAKLPVAHQTKQI